MSDILTALVRMVEREMRGGDARGGDILERAVAKKKLGSGNSGDLTTSNTTAQPNPLFPSFAIAPMNADGTINPGFSAYDTLQANATTATPFQINDLPPDVYTVHLSTQGQPSFVAAASGVMLSTEATVTFSVDGRQAIRKVSVNQGVRICGQADAITISVRDNSQLASARAYSTVKYKVVFGVSRGVRPDQQQPPTLAPVDAGGIVLGPLPQLIAAGGNLLIAVPQDVGVISTNTLVYDADGPGGVIVEGKVSVQYLNNAILLAQFDPRVMPWVPIRPGTNVINLINNTSDHIQFSTLFGIDG